MTSLATRTERDPAITTIMHRLRRVRQELTLTRSMLTDVPTAGVVAYREIRAERPGPPRTPEAILRGQLGFGPITSKERLHNFTEDFVRLALAGTSWSSASRRDLTSAGVRIAPAEDVVRKKMILASIEAVLARRDMPPWQIDEALDALSACPMEALLALFTQRMRVSVGAALRDSSTPSAPASEQAKQRPRGDGTRISEDFATVPPSRSSTPPKAEPTRAPEPEDRQAVPHAVAGPAKSGMPPLTEPPADLRPFVDQLKAAKAGEIDAAVTSAPESVRAGFLAWLMNVETVIVPEPALLTFGTAFKGVHPSLVQRGIGNAKARFARARQGGNGVLEALYPVPPQMVMVKLDRKKQRFEPIGVDLRTGQRSKYPIGPSLVAGCKAEIAETDKAIAMMGRAMYRLGIPSPLAEVEGVDRRSVFAAAEYEPWLQPESWQFEDDYVKSEIVWPEVCFDLLATPQEIASAAPLKVTPEGQALRVLYGTVDKPNGLEGKPVAQAALDSLVADFLNATSRKAMLLTLLRGYVREGIHVNDQRLWEGEPWVAEFSKFGLFGTRPQPESWTRCAPDPTLDPAIVEDLACRLVRLNGGEAQARVERAGDRMAELGRRIAEMRPGGRLAPKKKIDGADPDDPPCRIQVSGGQVRPPDAVLSKADRERLFARSVPMEGAASDPSFHLPVGSVVVIPDGEPAYLRGRGWSTMTDGRLLAFGQRYDPQDWFMPFHLDDDLLPKAVQLGPEPEFRLPPGPIDVYWRGYRWSYRKGNGPRRYDESVTQMVDRCRRMWTRFLDEMQRGVDHDGRAGAFCAARHPDFTDFGDWLPKGVTGPSAPRLMMLMDTIGGAPHAEAWIRLGAHETRWHPWTRHNLVRADWRKPRTVAYPLSWDRSWENALPHDRRWLGYGLAEGIYTSGVVQRFLQLPDDPTDVRTLREVMDDYRADMRAWIDRTINWKELKAPQSSAADLALAHEHRSLMTKHEEEKRSRDLERSRMQVFVDHRRKMNEIGRARYDAEHAHLAKTARLAYIPDPARDGPGAPIEIVPYDPAWRPEPSDPPPLMAAIEHRTHPLRAFEHRPLIEKPPGEGAFRAVASFQLERARSFLQ